jgi:hypothetical protein
MIKILDMLRTNYYYSKSYLIGLTRKNYEIFQVGKINIAYSEFYQRDIPLYESRYMSFKIVILLILATEYRINEIDHMINSIKEIERVNRYYNDIITFYDLYLEDDDINN